MRGTGSRLVGVSINLRPMTWSLQCPEGHTLVLHPGTEIHVGAADDCTLRLRGNDLPERIATILRLGADVWLHVLVAEPPVVLNGRPVRALARVLPGDRLCFGTFCVNVLGDALQERAAPEPAMTFALRVRGGTGSGDLYHGPVLHLNAQGGVVSPAAGTVEVSLVDGEIHLHPGGVEIGVNGHDVTASLRILPDDQIRVGSRRFLVEAAASPATEAVTQRLPALSPDMVPISDTAESGSENGGLWWLIAIAALIAASVSALLYFHR